VQLNERLLSGGHSKKCIRPLCSENGTQTYGKCQKGVKPSPNGLKVVSPDLRVFINQSLTVFAHHEMCHNRQLMTVVTAQFRHSLNVCFRRIAHILNPDLPAFLLPDSRELYCTPLYPTKKPLSECLESSSAGGFKFGVP